MIAVLRALWYFFVLGRPTPPEPQRCVEDMRTAELEKARRELFALELQQDEVRAAIAGYRARIRRLEQ